MIPFIDLKKQYRRIEKDVDLAVKKVFEHGQYILGPEVAELEKQLAALAGTKYCLACSSGTDALLMALMALNVKPGDAIFTTPFTFFATVEMVALTGATPVFADIDPDTYNIDPAKLREAILKVRKEGKLNPKAILSVDIFGQSADYDAIRAVAKEFDLPVIEDGAQAMGALYKGRRVPSFGLIGCTSFFPAKPLGCYGDGGAVFTDDKELHDKLFSILVHGRGSDNTQCCIPPPPPPRLDTSRRPSLQKLKSSRGNRNSPESAAGYSGLDGLVKNPRVAEDSMSVWSQYCVCSDRFEAIQSVLRDNDIPTARYYPIPMHLLKALDYLGYKKGDMPVTEKVAGHVFALPMHPYLEEDVIEKIGKVVRSVVK